MIRRIRPTLAFVAAVAALVGQHHVANRIDAQLGAALLAAGAGLFVAATWRVRVECDARVPDASVGYPTAIGWRRSLELLGPPALLAAAAVALFARGIAPNVAWLVWAGGVALLGHAAWRMGGWARPRRWPWAELLALLALAGLAAAFRLYRLNELPPGLWWDEAVAGLEAIRILEQPGYRPIYSAGLVNSPYLWFYLAAAFVAWLGRTPEALRSAALIGGILYVPALYTLGRQLFGPVAGLSAAGIGAVLLWNVNLSRNGWSYAWTLALDALAVALLARAVRARHAGLAVAAGLVWGIALQGYTPARLILAVVAVLFAHEWIRRGRQSTRPLLGQLLLFGSGAAIAAAPLLYFIVARPDEYFARARQVFIWNEVVSSGSLDPLLNSLRQHLLMFNVAGDRNGRHNLPGAPMLDQVTAALFVLGVAIAVARIRQQAWALLLVWCLAGLAGGALTLAWEAPQALRGIEAQTPAILLAAGAIASLVATISAGFRSIRDVARTSIPVALLVAIGVLNAHAYFVRKANDFGAWSAYSTAEAIAARAAQPLAATHTVYFDDTWLDHPTVRFLAPGLGSVRRLDVLNNVPLHDARPVAVFLRGELTAPIRDLESLYPSATARDWTPPFGGPPVARSLEVPMADIAASRGVRVLSQEVGGTAADERIESGLDVEVAAGGRRPPLDVELRTSLAVPSFGRYRFALEGPPGAALELNGVPVAQSGAEGEITLPRGNNRLAVRARVTEPSRLKVRWAPPGSGTLQDVPPEALSSLPGAGNGLLAAYRRGADWTATIAFAQVDRYLQRGVHLLPLPRPYTVEWTGWLTIQHEGLYRFQTDAVGRAWLWIDDVELASDVRGRSGEHALALSAGRHRIRVRFLDDDQFSRFDLIWTRPDGVRESVPTSVLLPPDGPVEQASAAPPPPPAPPLPLLGEPRVRWLHSDAGEVRGVSTAPDGSTFVANATTGEITRLGTDGQRMGAWTHPDLAEPVDVAAASDGTAWVLDSERGWIVRFGGQGSPLARVGGPALRMYRPRGLSVGPDGSLYVADTGGNDVVKLGPDGAEIARIGPDTGGPIEIKQPVDAAIGPDGDLYVVSAENGAIIRLDPTGRYRAHWTIQQSDTVRGPHLAFGPDGGLFVTDPGRGRILRYALDGRPAGVIDMGREGRVLRTPVGIDIAPDGAIVVADSSLPGVVALEASRDAR